MEKKRKRKSLTPTPPPAETTAIVSEPVVQDGAPQVQAAQAAAPAQTLEPTSSSEEEAAPESAPRQKVAAPQTEPAEQAAPPSEQPASSEAGSLLAEAPAKPKKKKKKKVAKKRASKVPESAAAASTPAPPSAPEAASRDVLHDKLDKLEAKLEEKKEEVARAARAGFASDPGVDDTSVPPVDLDAHDDFFSAGEKAHQQKATGASGSFDAIDPKTLRKMSTEAHQRRAHLSRYVKWAVGGAAALLALGFVVKTLRGHPADEPFVRHEVVHTAEAVPPPPVEQPKAAAAAAVEQGKVDELDDPQPADQDKKVDEDKKTDDKAPAAAASATDDQERKDEPLVDKPKTAWQEKQAAKAALERGANGAAIAAGERSVALDPSDGEAWLVLGGAYQAMGNIGQAKRCYKSCVSQGKKGPIGDCRDMLGSL